MREWGVKSPVVFECGVAWLQAAAVPLTSLALVPRSWDLLIMSLVVFTAISVPLSVSFGMPEGVGMEVLAHAITVLFGLDLIANFRTAYYDFQVRPAACSYGHASVATSTTLECPQWQCLPTSCCMR